MDDFAFLDTKFVDGLLTLTLKHPPVNVLNIAMLDELGRALGKAASDESVRLLLLTGQGEKCFCAGVDVVDHAADRVAGMLAAFHRVVRRLHDFPVPTVVALNGSALGGGLELALACDMLLAVDEAQLGQPEIRLGVLAPVAAVLLPRRLPPAIANEMLLGGAPISADQAQRYGLVNRVWPRALFAAEVRTFIEPYLNLSRAVQFQNKQTVREAEGMAFNAALAIAERRYLDELMATSDAQEGIAAFLEKRAPVWKHW